MTLMEMRFYPDFLTTSASTHVQSGPSILCNRLKSLILWQTALISAVTHAEICGRHPAPQWHENNQRSMESGGSAQIKCSAQRYNQYCFDWVVPFNKWLEAPQTNPSLVSNAFHLILRCRRDCRATAGFHTDSARCKRRAAVAKGASQTLWHLKRGCGKGRGDPTESGGGAGSC